MTQNLAVCPACGITVACDASGTAVGKHHLATPGGKTELCPGSHFALKPDVPEDACEVAPPDFREKYGTLADYAATCRPLWVAIQEDDRKEN